MNEKLGVVEFFTMEAGEYLERLDGLVSGRATPDVREFQRLTRALRGAAIMANQEHIASAAGAFEHVARAVREGTRQWDEATRQLTTRAVDDLKTLVRRVREWSDADTQKARDLTAALEGAVGRTPRQARPSVSGPDSGTRAFIAREGAALASALDRAARTLARNPLAHDPLQQILKVMQPLRGLASLADLPPMPDLLEGIERAVGEAARSTEPNPHISPTFDAAARALTEATHAVARDGKADPESPAVREFADLLDRLLGLDRPVVSIEALYFEDTGPHVVEQGAAPVSRERLGELELVSHGEHLKQVADGLDRAPTATQRRLRVQSLAGTFRGLEQGVGGPLAEAAARFARAARNAIAAGVAVTDAATFAQSLRDASEVLSLAAQTDPSRLVAELDLVTAQLPHATAALPEAPAAPRAAPREPARPRRPAAPPAAEPRATPPRAAPSPAPSRPPATPRKEAAEGAEGADLAGSWMRYERYVDALGLGAPSLDELLSGPPADPQTAPPRPAASASPAVSAPASEREAAAVVPITDLCYSGAAALERARTLRPQIRAAIERGETPTALIEEVLDLVELGLHTRP